MKKREQAPEANPNRFRCWMGLFPGHGCEKLFPIRDYNPRVDLCIECSNRIASQWGIGFSDLAELFSCISLIQGYSFPSPNPAQREKVIAMMEGLGVKVRKVPVYKPPQSQVPVNDREDSLPW